MAPTFIGTGDGVKLVGGEAKPRWKSGAMESDGSKQPSMRGVIAVLVVVIIWLSIVTSSLLYDRLSQLRSGPEPVVAFHAKGTRGTKGQIIFHETYKNNGGHYSTATGNFTAPVRGLYSFSFSFEADPDCGDRYAMASMLLRSGHISHSSSLPDTTGSGTILRTLNAGDQIGVELGGTCPDLIDLLYYNTFSGFLIQQL